MDNYKPLQMAHDNKQKKIVDKKALELSKKEKERQLKMREIVKKEKK